MIIIAAITHEDGSKGLPEGVAPPENVGVHFDGESYIYFETESEKDLYITANTPPPDTE